MNAEFTKLKQMLHEKGRRQLSIGRMTPETKDPKALKAIRQEYALLTREIADLKASIARIETA